MPVSRTHIGNTSESFLPAHVQERWILGGIFFLLLVLIFFRAPILLLEPRLWAEEASVFLRYAYLHGFLDSLLFVPQGTAGYFLLAATLPTTLAAHLFPLVYAPVVTTYFSLAVLLTLFAVILWGHSSVWNTVGKKALACLIILFAASSTGDVWLNSINLQVYCGIIAMCLLLEDLRAVSPRRQWSYRLLLVFCGLSGVYTTFLSGLFVVKAWLEKSREALIHAGLILCTSLIQIVVFFSLYFSNKISGKKLAGLNLGKTTRAWFSAQVALPLLGPQWGKRWQSSLDGLVGALSGESVMTVIAFLTGVFAVGYLLLVLYSIVPRFRQQTQVLLLGGYVCTAIGTSLFSAHGMPVARYAVTAGVFFLWMLLNNLRFPLVTFRALVSAVLLTGALVLGARGYRTTQANSFFVCNAQCPKWADELKRCELTSECVLTVWPYPRWKFSWPVSHNPINP